MDPSSPLGFTLKEMLLAIAAVACVLAAWVVMGWWIGAMLAFALSLAALAHSARRRHPMRLKLSIALSLAMGVVAFVATFAWGVLGLGPIYRAESYPHGLQQMISTTGASAWGTKAECVSKFIDSQYVWRIRLSEQQLARVLEHFELAAVPSPPTSIRALFPRRWRPPRNENLQYYATSGFELDGRGADGLHYFGIYNPETEQFYVWCKDNF